jgi:ergothioneine biosynthesis protein EgtB
MMAADARLLAGAALAEALRDARATTLARTMDQDDDAWNVPQQSGVNLPAWELGHLAWFAEFWILRGPHHAGADGFVTAAKPPSLAGPDAIFDSARLAHADRWRVALPSRDELAARLAAQLDACIDAIPRDADDDDANYFHRLALFHEEMHAEAFAVLAQTLGIDDKAGLVARITTRPPRPSLYLPATRWLLGSSGAGFRFDNEAEPHPVDVPEFEIDAQAVTWGQFGEFVEDGGYDERAHWSQDGWDWLQREGRRTPRHVDQMRHGVLQRRFGVLARVAAAHPAVHVSWHEGDAWCRWAGRRLPSEVEWEAAAHQGATRGFRWGDVREWTATTFRPYPGFVAGPWRDYSLPAFGTHKVLRGASFATRPSLRSARLRGFAPAERDDGFFGFRSCAA